MLIDDESVETLLGREELNPELISQVGNRFRNLMDEGFTVQEALELVRIPTLDWHRAAELKAKGAPFALIFDECSP